MSNRSLAHEIDRIEPLSPSATALLRVLPGPTESPQGVRYLAAKLGQKKPEPEFMRAMQAELNGFRKRGMASVTPGGGWRLGLGPRPR